MGLSRRPRVGETNGAFPGAIEITTETPCQSAIGDAIGSANRSAIRKCQIAARPNYFLVSAFCC